MIINAVFLKLFFRNNRFSLVFSLPTTHFFTFLMRFEHVFVKNTCIYI